MRKLYIIAASALLVMGAVSCKKNSDVQDPESKEGKVKVVFNASSKEGSEKTSLSGSSVLWSEGDQVKIYAGSSTKGSDFEITDGWGTTAGIFEGWLSTEATAPYYAVYPASAAAGIVGDNISFIIPSSQSYVENSFAPNVAPMIAYSASDKSLAFKNMCGFIKLQLTGEGRIYSIYLESESEQSLSGVFSVSKTDPTLALSESSVSREVVINFDEEGVELSETPINVIIAVAPNNFAVDDIFFEIEGEGDRYFRSKIGGFNLPRSKGKVIPVEVDFEATTGYFPRVGPETDYWVKWVQLWEDGPKWAEYNVGATSEGEYGGYYKWGSLYDRGDPVECDRSEYSTPDCDIKNIQNTEYEAGQLWGPGLWEMPTKDDMQGLIDNCDIEEFYEIPYKDTGVYGVLFKGKQGTRYENNSVFFPVAGCHHNCEIYFEDLGCYWSSSQDDDCDAYFMWFGDREEYGDNPLVEKGEGSIGYGMTKDRGISVRLILYEE